MSGSGERFLVTGAMGCIGAWTVRTLIRDGASVTSFDLGTDARRLAQIMTADELAAVDIVKGDITDLRQVSATLDGKDITNVIHLAALQVPFCRADPPLGAMVNVVGTVNVFEAVKRRGAGMAPVVYTSSIGMYAADDADPATGRLLADAEAHPHNHYGVYKQANEGNARVYWLDDGVPSIGLRPMTVYGVGRDQGMTSGPTKAIVAAVLGRPLHGELRRPDAVPVRRGRGAPAGRGQPQPRRRGARVQHARHDGGGGGPRRGDRVDPPRRAAGWSTSTRSASRSRSRSTTTGSRSSGPCR